MGFQKTGNIEGDAIMFLASTGHGEYLTVEIFVADGTALFALEIVGDGEEGGGWIHGGLPG
jgi:hypothetical protein